MSFRRTALRRRRVGMSVDPTLGQAGPGRQALWAPGRREPGGVVCLQTWHSDGQEGNRRPWKKRLLRFKHILPTLIPKEPAPCQAALAFSRGVPTTDAHLPCHLLQGPEGRPPAASTATETSCPLRSLFGSNLLFSLTLFLLCVLFAPKCQSLPNKN